VNQCCCVAVARLISPLYCSLPSSSGVNASLTLGGNLPLPFSPAPLPSPPFLSPPYPCPSLPTSPSEVGPVNPATGSGGALLAPPAGSGAEPQPKSNLLHFSLKIRHLVAKFLIILVKSQLTEKQPYHYKVMTIFTIMEVSLLSHGNINICCLAILQTHPLRPTCP